MSNIYFLVFIIFLFSCTRIQYVGSSFQQTKHVDVYVTDTSLTRSHIIIGQGYIKSGSGLHGEVINWNRVLKTAINKGKKNGADAVFIIQRRAVSPLPGIISRSHTDSAQRSIHQVSRMETYYPVSTWHDIFYLKYN